MAPLLGPLVHSLFTGKIPEASCHTLGLIPGSRSEPVWTKASEKLPLPRKQDQPLRSKECAKWLVVELELQSENEKRSSHPMSTGPTVTSPVRPGCSLDGGPLPTSPRGSCPHAGHVPVPGHSTLMPSPWDPEAQGGHS